MHHFTKTGSGQTKGKLKKEWRFLRARDVQIYSQWVGIVHEALASNGATDGEKEMFFGGTAAKAYGVKLHDREPARHRQ